MRISPHAIPCQWSIWPVLTAGQTVPEGAHMEEDEMAEMMEKAAEGIVHPHVPPGGTVIMGFTP